jgi:hypothetical protein
MTRASISAPVPIKALFGIGDVAGMKKPGRSRLTGLFAMANVLLRSGAGGAPGSIINIATGEADIGQFTVRKAGERAQISAVAEESPELGDKHGQHWTPEFLSIGLCTAYNRSRPAQESNNCHGSYAKMQ